MFYKKIKFPEESKITEEWTRQSKESKITKGWKQSGETIGTQFEDILELFKVRFEDDVNPELIKLTIHKTTTSYVLHSQFMHSKPTPNNIVNDNLLKTLDSINEKSTMEQVIMACIIDISEEKIYRLGFGGKYGLLKYRGY